MTTIIDLSKSIRYNPGDPWFMRIKVKHKPHRKGGLLVRLLGLPSRLFPPGFKGWADDTIKNMGVHSTTHVDAPWHYGPKTGGQPARTIDRIPLEWFFGDGVVINMSHKEDFDPITSRDLEKAVSETGSVISRGTIVLIRTDRDKLGGTPDYFKRGTGMSAEATMWLIDKGVRVMGIDQWGWDMPLPWQIAQAKKKKDPELFWQAHRVGTKTEYLHIEQLINLKSLPPHGFKVAAFPLKVTGGSAGPARVAAIIED
ncbi:MAG: cyclase family protein [Thermodesulfobacteriota bacterium]